jgi:hypothetical protein
MIRLNKPFLARLIFIKSKTARGKGWIGFDPSLSAMQICKFLFFWRDYIGAYEPVNSHHLEKL